MSKTAITLCAVVLLAGTAWAQNQPTPRARPGESLLPAQRGDRPAPPSDQEAGYYRASEILGSTVRGEGGQELGKIQDLLIEQRSQRVTHFILGEGREVTAQSSVRVVPWTISGLRFEAEQRIVTVPLPVQRFEQAPTFTVQQLQSGPSVWVNEVNRFYGVRDGAAPRGGIETDARRRPGTAPPRRGDEEGRARPGTTPPRTTEPETETETRPGTTPPNRDVESEAGDTEGTQPPADTTTEEPEPETEQPAPPENR